MTFIEELKWRGMIHDIMPGTEEQLNKEETSVYVGIDPTADSLHIGHMVSVMMLTHLQRAGHKPIALIGGATGMIGDPSGKSDERNLLDEETIRHNQHCIQLQLERFLDFNVEKSNCAQVVNNYDWMKEFSFLEFVRDIGKHITVNYMMAKDSVKKRLGSDSKSGLSFTEFTYQLVQGTDFLHLYQHHNCLLQMGGSDQWGNMTTGTELIRRKIGGQAYALTWPLITKADGNKFGKTESGNIWLDPARTSPYQFYQFWLNTSDEDALKYIKIFTFLPMEEIEQLSKQHQEQAHQRLLQKTLAREITCLVHSEQQYEAAVEASGILFGKGTTDSLKKLDEDTFLAVFEGVPQFQVASSLWNEQLTLNQLLTEHTQVMPSKGELRRTVQGGGLSLNKEKVSDMDMLITDTLLLNHKYLLIQKGKKNYYLIIKG